MQCIPEHVKYVEHFQGECLIHYYNLPDINIFICAMWNNKGCKIVRKDRETRHLITIAMILFSQENMATNLLSGCCAFS